MVTGTLYGFLYADGTMQVESNDRELRILLKRSVMYDKGQVLEYFYTVFYVKDGSSWQKTTNTANYRNADEFYDAISKVEDFTLAVRDIEQQKNGEFAGE